MKIVKKLILSLSIAVTMAIAFVIGCVTKTPASSKDVVGSVASSETSVVSKTEKPTSYTFKPGQVVFQKGGNALNYTYNPSVNQGVTPPTVAYEYVFRNTMNRATAVNLKEIDTTAVTISYAWDDGRINTDNEFTAYDHYECQKLETYGSKVYIYVIVTPINTEIPVEFTSSVVWYYGIPKEITIANNINNTTTTQTIVTGQELSLQSLNVPTAPEGYYFDDWFLDENYTQVATSRNIGQTLYARFHNCPLNSTSVAIYNSTTGTYCMIGYGDLWMEVGTNTLIVPSRYNDGVNGWANVTSAERGSVENCFELVLPYTILELPEGAFGMTAELDIVVDATSCVNLVRIGYEAFWTANVKIDLSKCTKLEYIEGCAFEDSNLSGDLILPNTVISIGECAFYGCSGLTGIVVENGNRVYDSRNNCNAIIETSTNTLIVGCKNTIIPNTVTSIGAGAFYGCTSLTSIDLSKCTSLTSIGVGAFHNCDNLTSIDLPSSLTSIGDAAFSNCDNLTSIDLPSSLTSIGRYAFSYCDGLTSLTFKASGTWYYGTQAQQEAMNGGTPFEIVAGTNYKSTFLDTSTYNKYWYKK